MGGVGRHKACPYGSDGGIVTPILTFPLRGGRDLEAGYVWEI